jgi:hypothetical protein
MPAVEQETTLLCISYNAGSGYCSNAIWKGVPLVILLAQAKPRPDATTVLFRAADGYYETFRIEKAMEPHHAARLRDEWRAAPAAAWVSATHGRARALRREESEMAHADRAAGRNDARLVRRRGCGFYKEQGWGREGDVIPTTSRIDAPQVGGERFAAPFKVGQPVELRGMAFGGDRGISQVEISTDWGGSWEPATSPTGNENLMVALDLQLDASLRRRDGADRARDGWRGQTADRGVSLLGAGWRHGYHRVRAVVAA